eukprot:scaffold14559_cov137-Cylindrotheca_fusiformis.AAC.2
MMYVGMGKGVAADKDDTPVASFNSSGSFKDDEMENELSSGMCKPPPFGENSAPPKSSLRVDSKSSELRLLSRSSSVRRNDSMLSELTINKFNIKTMGLIGREREIEILKSCYHRIANEENGNTTSNQSISPQSL